jgi:hypothetical protein
MGQDGGMSAEAGGNAVRQSSLRVEAFPAHGPVRNTVSIRGVLFGRAPCLFEHEWTSGIRFGLPVKVALTH